MRQAKLPLLERISSSRPSSFDFSHHTKPIPLKKAFPLWKYWRYNTLRLLVILTRSSTRRPPLGPFPKIFEERVPEAKVFTLDLAGMGTERRRNTPISVKETMEDARHRWEALNADFGGPWGLLAISFGGMVALEWGAQHPYDFQRIVTINTSVGSLSPAQHRLRPGVWLDFLKIARSKSAIQKERTILSFNSNITAGERYHARGGVVWLCCFQAKPYQKWYVRS